MTRGTKHFQDMVINHTLRGKQLTFEGEIYTIVDYGIKDGYAYAKTLPYNNGVEKAIVQEVESHYQGGDFHLENIQRRLDP